eukprot:767945-Hanusia_phi.AAC.1
MYTRGVGFSKTCIEIPQWGCPLLSGMRHRAARRVQMPRRGRRLIRPAAVTLVDGHRESERLNPIARLAAGPRNTLRSPGRAPTRFESSGQAYDGLLGTVNLLNDCGSCSVASPLGIYSPHVRSGPSDRGLLTQCHGVILSELCAPTVRLANCRL